MMRPYYLGAAMLAAVLHTAPACPQQARTVVPVSATGPLAGEKVYGRSFALLIGVNQYVNLPANSLHYAVKDVTALRDILVRSYGFPLENIMVLTDAQATRDKIRAALDDLCDTKRIGKDDRILIYFSGHGQSIKLGEGKEYGYLIPYDAEKIDLADSVNIAPYRRSCVSVGEIRETLDASPARHILMLADCCFSGLLVEDKALPQALPQLSPNTLAVMAHKRTRQIMTAGSAGELSQESAMWGHGAFTYKLLEDLEAQAALEVTAFTARSLYSVLQLEVLDLTRQMQNPKFADRGAGGEFLFITTARNAPPPAHALPPLLPAETAPKVLEQELRSYQDSLKGGSSLPFLRKYAPGRFSEWFQECQKGNAIAEFLVARCFEEGIAVPTDNAKSLKWATRAADHGNMFAMNLLGYVNEYGIGTAKDHATALQWYQKAAEQGNGLAMLNLGKAYADADSPEHDYAKAMQAYRKSVDAGYAEAMRMIGGLYAYGSGVPKDPVEAKKWYRQAADAGDTYSAGLLLADRIGPAFKSYAEAEAAPPAKAAALETVRNLLSDYNRADLAAADAVLRNDDITVAVGKMQDGEKADAAKKTAEGGMTDPMLALHDQMLERYIRLYQQSSQDTKVQYINSFATATAVMIKKRYEGGQYDDVQAFWKKSYEGLTISNLTQGEKDGMIRELNTCINGLLKGGNRKEGKQLLEDALALCDGVLKDRPWDWYSKDAYGGLCLTAAATLWELGDNDAVQPLLQRGWSVLLKEFGKEDMLKRYAKLPLKGQVPDGASATDAAFFKGFRTEEQKKAVKTEKPGKIEGAEKSDKAEGAGELKKFTVPIDFSGTKYPFDIYVFSGPNGYTELQDQFRWVKDYRGGVVPPDVLSSFMRLNKIAVENKVDFCALCVYALDTASKDTPAEAAKQDVKKTKVKKTRDFDFSIEESILKEIEAKKSVPQKP